MKIYLEPPLEREIKSAILKELVVQLNTATTSAISEINDRAKRYTAKLIANGDFAHAFTGAELRGSFGIRPGEYSSRMESITRIIADDTHIFPIPITLLGDKLQGGWLLAIGTNLFDKLKNSPAGITRTEKRVNVPWLKWTLEVGNAVVIADFSVSFQLGKGRSHFAIMIPNKVVGYRVPPQFAGTDHSNWITRDIIPYLDDYSEIILRTINKYAK